MTSTTQARAAPWRRRRLKELMNAQYTSLLRDGVAGVLSALNTLRPYVADLDIIKHECINHQQADVQGPGECREAINSQGEGKEKHPDDLNRKGKLIQVRIKKWSQYYCNAIVSKAPDVEAARHAIWAILF